MRLSSEKCTIWGHELHRWNLDCRYVSVKDLVSTTWLTNTWAGPPTWRTVFYGKQYPCWVVPHFGRYPILAKGTPLDLSSGRGISRVKNSGFYWKLLCTSWIAWKRDELARNVGNIKKPTLPVGQPTCYKCLLRMDYMNLKRQDRTNCSSSPISLPLMSIHRDITMVSFITFEKCTYLPGQLKSLRVWNLFWTACISSARRQKSRHTCYILLRTGTYAHMLTISNRVAPGFLASVWVQSASCNYRRPTTSRKMNSIE